MADPIDPRLYVSSLPPRGQPYTAAPQHSAGHPYYLAAASHQPPPHPSPPAPLGAALDPALEQTSPTQPESPTAADDGDGDDHDDHDHEGTHETPGSAKSPGDSKRPRACDSCRGLKVRCDQERPDVSCKRCAKAGRACITTPPTRKRQKKADSRVAELERKIDALTATLHAQNPATPGQHDAGTAASSAAEAAFRLGALAHDWRTSPAAGYAAAPPGYGPAQNFQPSPAAKRRKLDGGSHALSHTLSHTAAPARTPAAAAAAAACSPRQTISEDMDAIHRDLAEHPEMKRSPKTRIHADYSYINGLIDSLMSPDVAERVFIRYNQQICPHFPAVPFAPGTTAAELREKKPLLFLSLLAGSSHGSSEQLVPQHVQRELTKLLKDQLADIIWRNGEKSLEIVQALQIAVLWYRPPLHFEQHNFYMMVNCAAVMALDLGLGRKTTPDVMKLSIGPFRRYHPNSSSIEARRTFLVCYYLCMSITMVLRRPILLRWTKYMEESIKILETSPDALPSDKLLCRQVKMARIGEDISVQFCMDDPSIEVAISEPKVIYAMKIFENELQQLREDNAAMGEVDPTLRLAEHVTNLYLHEIALHKDQGGTDLHPPYTEESVTPGGKGNVSIGPAHIGALGECLTATHGILDTMLSIPLDVLLALPVIFCVRAIYAIVCLMKMWVSVTSSNEVGSVIKTEHLQIEAYTEQLVSMFNAIVSRDAQSPHGKFYFVAKRLQERFIQIKQGTTKEQSEPEFRSPKQSDEATRQPAHHSSTNQTPLHLLSEVAMGSSNNASSHQQAQSHARSQQQAQAALQAAHHAQQSMHSNWYSGMPAQQMDMNGMPQANFDLNFDFTQFDLGTGSDADLSALFIPDAVMWNYPTTDPNLQGYNGFQSGL